jgi:hypothetical protein
VIETARLPGTVPISDILRIRSAAGRVSLPLNQPIFVRFEHVSGVPSAVNGEGYSVFKLRILDTLIDRLSTLKGKYPEGEKKSGMEPEAVDALIEGLKKELHNLVARAAATPFGPALGAGAADNGLILNISV